MAEPKQTKKPLYQPGQATLEGGIQRVAQIGAPAVAQQIAEIQKDLPENDKAKNLEIASNDLIGIQERMAATPEALRPDLIEQEKALLAQKTAASGRGLSASERIVAAILGAAPLIASAATPGSNFYEASKGSSQILSGLQSSAKDARNAEVADIDSRLGLIQDQKKENTRLSERREDFEYKDKADLRDFEQQKELKRMDSEERNSVKGESLKKSLAAEQGRWRAIVERNPELKDARKAISVYKGFKNTIDTPNGFSDFMSSYAAGKIGDPSTGIRDAERSDLWKAGGFMEQLRNAPDKFKDGSGFSKQARANFKRAMEEAVKVHQDNIRRSRDQFDALAESSPFRPATVENGVITDQMLRSVGLDLEDVGGSSSVNKDAGQQAPKKDYNSMSLEELKALKKARGL